MAEDIIDERAQALYRLAACLQGQGYTMAYDSKIPKVDVSHDGGHLATVSCDRRASDNGKLWFHEHGIPVAEADHIHDAVIWIKGRAGGDR